MASTLFELIFEPDIKRIEVLITHYSQNDLLTYDHNYEKIIYKENIRITNNIKADY